MIDLDYARILYDMPKLRFRKRKATFLISVLNSVKTA